MKLSLKEIKKIKSLIIWRGYEEYGEGYKNVRNFHIRCTLPHIFYTLEIFQFFNVFPLKSTIIYLSI